MPREVGDERRLNDVGLRSVGAMLGRIHRAGADVRIDGIESRVVPDLETFVPEAERLLAIAASHDSEFDRLARESLEHKLQLAHSRSLGRAIHPGSALDPVLAL